MNEVNEIPTWTSISSTDRFRELDTEEKKRVFGVWEDQRWAQFGDDTDPTVVERFRVGSELIRDGFNRPEDYVEDPVETEGAVAAKAEELWLRRRRQFEATRERHKHLRASREQTPDEEGNYVFGGDTHDTLDLTRSASDSIRGSLPWQIKDVKDLTSRVAKRVTEKTKFNLGDDDLLWMKEKGLEDPTKPYHWVARRHMDRDAPDAAWDSKVEFNYALAILGKEEFTMAILALPEDEFSEGDKRRMISGYDSYRAFAEQDLLEYVAGKESGSFFLPEERRGLFNSKADYFLVDDEDGLLEKENFKMFLDKDRIKDIKNSGDVPTDDFLADEIAQLWLTKRGLGDYAEKVLSNAEGSDSIRSQLVNAYADAVLDFNEAWDDDIVAQQQKTDGAWRINPNYLELKDEEIRERVEESGLDIPAGTVEQFVLQGHRVKDEAAEHWITASEVAASNNRMASAREIMYFVKAMQADKTKEWSPRQIKEEYEAWLRDPKEHSPLTEAQIQKRMAVDPITTQWMTHGNGLLHTRGYMTQLGRWLQTWDTTEDSSWLTTPFKRLAFVTGSGLRAAEEELVNMIPEWGTQIMGTAMTLAGSKRGPELLEGVSKSQEAAHLARQSWGVGGKYGGMLGKEIAVLGLTAGAGKLYTFAGDYVSSAMMARRAASLAGNSRRAKQLEPWARDLSTGTAINPASKFKKISDSVGLQGYSWLQASRSGTAMYQDAYLTIRDDLLSHGVDPEEAEEAARLNAIVPAMGGTLLTYSLMRLMPNGTERFFKRGEASKQVTARNLREASNYSPKQWVSYMKDPKFREKAVSMMTKRYDFRNMLGHGFIGGGIREAAEEFLDEFGQGIISMSTYNPDLEWSTIVAGAAEAALVGGMLGGAVSRMREQGRLPVSATQLPAHIRTSLKELDDIARELDLKGNPKSAQAIREKTASALNELNKRPARREARPGQPQEELPEKLQPGELGYYVTLDGKKGRGILVVDEQGTEYVVPNVEPYLDENQELPTSIDPEMLGEDNAAIPTAQLQGFVREEMDANTLESIVQGGPLMTDLLSEVDDLAYIEDNDEKLKALLAIQDRAIQTFSGNVRHLSDFITAAQIRAKEAGVKQSHTVLSISEKTELDGVFQAYETDVDQLVHIGQLPPEGPELVDARFKSRRDIQFYMSKVFEQSRDTVSEEDQELYQVSVDVAFATYEVSKILNDLSRSDSVKESTYKKHLDELSRFRENFRKAQEGWVSNPDPTKRAGQLNDLRQAIDQLYKGARTAFRSASKNFTSNELASMFAEGRSPAFARIEPYMDFVPTGKSDGIKATIPPLKTGPAVFKDVNTNEDGTTTPVKQSDLSAGELPDLHHIVRQMREEGRDPISDVRYMPMDGEVSPDDPLISQVVEIINSLATEEETNELSIEEILAEMGRQGVTTGDPAIDEDLAFSAAMVSGLEGISNAEGYTIDRETMERGLRASRAAFQGSPEPQGVDPADPVDPVDPVDPLEPTLEEMAAMEDEVTLDNAEEFAYVNSWNRNGNYSFEEFVNELPAELRGTDMDGGIKLYNAWAAAKNRMLDDATMVEGATNQEIKHRQKFYDGFRPDGNFIATEVTKLFGDPQRSPRRRDDAAIPQDAEVGDEIEIFNAEGEKYKAKITAISEESGKIKVIDQAGKNVVVGDGVSATLTNINSPEYRIRNSSKKISGITNNARELTPLSGYSDDQLLLLHETLDTEGGANELDTILDLNAIKTLLRSRGIDPATGESISPEVGPTPEVEPTPPSFIPPPIKLGVDALPPLTEEQVTDQLKQLKAAEKEVYKLDKKDPNRKRQLSELKTRINDLSRGAPREGGRGNPQVARNTAYQLLNAYFTQEGDTTIQEQSGPGHIVKPVWDDKKSWYTVDTLVPPAEGAGKYVRELTKTFATQLAEGVITNLDQVDDVIRRSRKTPDAPFFNKMDENILRLITYEALYTDTPAKVISSEAQRLVEDFGDPEYSLEFINGVVSTLLKNLESQKPSTEFSDEVKNAITEHANLVNGGDVGATVTAYVNLSKMLGGVVETVKGVDKPAVAIARLSDALGLTKNAEVELDRKGNDEGGQDDNSTLNKTVKYNAVIEGKPQELELNENAVEIINSAAASLAVDANKGLSEIEDREALVTRLRDLAQNFRSGFLGQMEGLGVREDKELQRAAQAYFQSVTRLPLFNLDVVNTLAGDPAEELTDIEEADALRVALEDARGLVDQLMEFNLVPVEEQKQAAEEAELTEEELPPHQVLVDGEAQDRRWSRRGSFIQIPEAYTFEGFPGTAKVDIEGYRLDLPRTGHEMYVYQKGKSWVINYQGELVTNLRVGRQLFTPRADEFATFRTMRDAKTSAMALIKEQAPQKPQQVSQPELTPLEKTLTEALAKDPVMSLDEAVDLNTGFETNKYSNLFPGIHPHPLDKFIDKLRSERLKSGVYITMQDWLIPNRKHRDSISPPEWRAVHPLMHESRRIHPMRPPGDWSRQVLIRPAAGGAVGLRTRFNNLKSLDKFGLESGQFRKVTLQGNNKYDDLYAKDKKDAGDVDISDKPVTVNVYSIPTVIRPVKVLDDEGKVIGEVMPSEAQLKDGIGKEEKITYNQFQEHEIAQQKALGPLMVPITPEAMKRVNLEFTGTMTEFRKWKKEKIAANDALRPGDGKATNKELGNTITWADSPDKVGDYWVEQIQEEPATPINSFPDLQKYAVPYDPAEPDKFIFTNNPFHVAAYFSETDENGNLRGPVPLPEEYSPSTSQIKDAGNVGTKAGQLNPGIIIAKDTNNKFWIIGAKTNFPLRPGDEQSLAPDVKKAAGVLNTWVVMAGSVHKGKISTYDSSQRVRLAQLQEKFKSKARQERTETEEDDDDGSGFTKASKALMAAVNEFGGKQVPAGWFTEQEKAFFGVTGEEGSVLEVLQNAWASSTQTKLQGSEATESPLDQFNFIAKSLLAILKTRIENHLGPDGKLVDTKNDLQLVRDIWKQYVSGSPVISKLPETKERKATKEDDPETFQANDPLRGAFNGLLDAYRYTKSGGITALFNIKHEDTKKAIRNLKKWGSVGTIVNKTLDTTRKGVSIGSKESKFTKADPTEENPDVFNNITSKDLLESPDSNPGMGNPTQVGESAEASDIYQGGEASPFDGLTQKTRDEIARIIKQQMDVLEIKDGDTESARKALVKIEEGSKDGTYPPHYGELAGLLLSSGNINFDKVKFRIDSNIAVAAYFQKVGDESHITISDKKTNNRGVHDLLVHEFLHAALDELVTNPKTEAQRLAVEAIDAMIDRGRIHFPMLKRNRAGAQRRAEDLARSESTMYDLEVIKQLVTESDSPIAAEYDPNSPRFEEIELGGEMESPELRNLFYQIRLEEYRAGEYQDDVTHMRSAFGINPDGSFRNVESTRKEFLVQFLTDPTTQWYLKEIDKLSESGSLWKRLIRALSRGITTEAPDDKEIILDTFLTLDGTENYIDKAALNRLRELAGSSAAEVETAEEFRANAPAFSEGGGGYHETLAEEEFWESYGKDSPARQAVNALGVTISVDDSADIPRIGSTAGTVLVPSTGDYSEKDLIAAAIGSSYTAGYSKGARMNALRGLTEVPGEMAETLPTLVAEAGNFESLVGDMVADAFYDPKDVAEAPKYSLGLQGLRNSILSGNFGAYAARQMDTMMDAANRAFPNRRDLRRETYSDDVFIGDRVTAARALRKFVEFSGMGSTEAEVFPEMYAGLVEASADLGVPVQVMLDSGDEIAGEFREQIDQVLQFQRDEFEEFKKNPDPDNQIATKLREEVLFGPSEASAAEASAEFDEFDDVEDVEGEPPRKGIISRGWRKVAKQFVRTPDPDRKGTLLEGDTLDEMLDFLEVAYLGRSIPTPMFTPTDENTRRWFESKESIEKRVGAKRYRARKKAIKAKVRTGRLNAEGAAKELQKLEEEWKEGLEWVSRRQRGKGWLRDMSKMFPGIKVDRLIQMASVSGKGGAKFNEMAMELRGKISKVRAQATSFTANINEQMFRMFKIEDPRSGKLRGVDGLPDLRLWHDDELAREWSTPDNETVGQQIERDINMVLGVVEDDVMMDKYVPGARAKILQEMAEAQSKVRSLYATKMAEGRRLMKSDNETERMDGAEIVRQGEAERAASFRPLKDEYMAKLTKVYEEASTKFRQDREWATIRLRRLDEIAAKQEGREDPTEMGKSLVTGLLAMREAINDLQKEIINNGILDDQMTSTTSGLFKNLNAKIKASFGIYLSSSYQGIDEREYARWLESEDPSSMDPEAKRRWQMGYDYFENEVLEEYAKRIVRADSSHTLGSAKALAKRLDMAKKSEVVTRLSRFVNAFTTKGVGRGPTVGAMNSKVLEPKVAIDPKLREVMGLYQDNIYNAGRTLMNLGAMVSNHKFLQSIKDTLEGLQKLSEEQFKDLSPQERGGLARQASMVFITSNGDEARRLGLRSFVPERGKTSVTGEHFGPLRHFYGPKHIVEALHEMVETRQSGGAVGDFMMMIASQSMANLTTRRFRTHVRNFVGNTALLFGAGMPITAGQTLFNALATGTTNLFTRGKDVPGLTKRMAGSLAFRDAARTGYARGLKRSYDEVFGWKGDDLSVYSEPDAELREEYAEMLITGQDVRTNIIEEIRKSLEFGGFADPLLSMKGVPGPTGMWLKDLGDNLDELATLLYAAEDDFWKITNYEGQLVKLAKVFGFGTPHQDTKIIGPISVPFKKGRTRVGTAPHEVRDSIGRVDKGTGEYVGPMTDEQADAILKMFPPRTPLQMELLNTSGKKVAALATLKRQASHRVNMTMPNYSNTIDLIKQLKRAKLTTVGSPFISWHGEIARIMKDTPKLALEEIAMGLGKNPSEFDPRLLANVRNVGSALSGVFTGTREPEQKEMLQMGINRLLNYTFAVTILPAFSVATVALTAAALAALTGDEEDDEENFYETVRARFKDVNDTKRFLSEWYQTGTIVVWDTDNESGNVTFMDISHLLPHSTITDPIKIFTGTFADIVAPDSAVSRALGAQGDDRHRSAAARMWTAAERSFIDLFDPFLTPQMWVDEFKKTTEERDPLREQESSPFMSRVFPTGLLPGGKSPEAGLLARLAALAIVPGTLTDLTDIAERAIGGPTTVRGREMTLGQSVMGGLLGQKVITTNIPDKYERKLKFRGQQLFQAGQNLRRAIRSGSTVTKQQARNAYENYYNSVKQSLISARLDYLAAGNLTRPGENAAILQSSSLPRSIQRQIASGVMERPSPSRRDFEITYREGLKLNNPGRVESLLDAMSKVPNVELLDID